MNRRTRRRIQVALGGAVIGISSPLWGPPILRGIPAFEVRTVEVAGNRFADADELRALAGIDAGCSVWDDPGDWERAILAHPLIEEVRVRRAGWDELRIEVREVQAVAAVATPGLVAVDADGYRLDVDPSEHLLDLPILTAATLDSTTGRIVEEEARRSLAVLEEIGSLAPEFVQRVSEVVPIDSEAFEMHLLDGSLVERLTLPYSDASRAFLRAAAAIQAAEQKGTVLSADARYEEKVFVRTEGDG